MNIEYSMLENGFDFIVYAINSINVAREREIDDFARKRLIKYALLHLSSGVELVFKHRLLQENWTYIFSDMNKANKQDFELGDFKSIDSSTCITRLINLCNIDFSPKQLKTLEQLRKRRNKIEHFLFTDSKESIESLMRHSLSVIMNFIAENIKIEAMTEEENDLFEQIQKDTIDLAEVVNERVKLIEMTIQNCGAPETLEVCPECLMKYLLIGDCDVKCLYCYYTDTPDKVADGYVSNVLGISQYSVLKEGDDYPVYECFECNENSMAVDLDNGVCLCFNCGHKSNLENVVWCNNCGQPFYSAYKDKDIPVCSSCLKDILLNGD